MSTTNCVCDALALKQLFFDQILCGAAQKLSTLGFEAHSAGLRMPITGELYRCSFEIISSEASPAVYVTHNRMPGIGFEPSRLIDPLYL